MNNVISQNRTMSDTQQVKAETNIHAYKYQPEYAENAKLYNQNLSVLNPDYTNIVPLRKVIVRCFVIEPTVTEGGLVLPYKQMLSYQTKSGQGKAGEFETDWPYADKAVVVSVPEGTTLIKQGDIVQLTRNAIEIRVAADGNNAVPVIANGYVHVDSKNEQTPKDMTDPDYGYVLISLGEIEAKY